MSKTIELTGATAAPRPPTDVGPAEKPRVTPPAAVRKVIDPRRKVAVKRRLGALVVVLALTLFGCSRSGPTAAGVKVADAAALGLSEKVIPRPGEVLFPTVAVDGNLVYLAWAESADRTDGAEHVHGSADRGSTGPELSVYVAHSDDGGRSFGNPVLVGEDQPESSARIRVHSGGPVQVLLGREGEVYLLWGVNSASDAVSGITTLYLSRSVDGGETFSRPVAIPKDLASAGADYHHAVVDPGGSLLVGFLDYREEYQGREDAQIQVRVVRSVDGGRSFSPSVQVATSSCECCQVAMAAADDEVVMSWRQLERTPGGDPVRDLVVARAAGEGRQWSRPSKVHDDGWRVDQCPHAGPVLAADSAGQLHAAWYTGRPGAAGIFYAASDDGGRTFEDPAAIFTGARVAPSLVSLAVDDAGARWLAWEDHAATTQIRLGRLDPSGGMQTVESPVGPGHAPRLAARNGGWALTWAGRGLRVLVGSGPPE